MTNRTIQSFCVDKYPCSFQILSFIKPLCGVQKGPNNLKLQVQGNMQIICFSQCTHHTNTPTTPLVAHQTWDFLQNCLPLHQLLMLLTSLVNKKKKEMRIWTRLRMCVSTADHAWKKKTTKAGIGQCIIFTLTSIVLHGVKMTPV